MVDSEGRPITKASVGPPSTFRCSILTTACAGPRSLSILLPFQSNPTIISPCGSSRARNQRHHPQSIMDTPVRLPMEDCVADGLTAREKAFRGAFLSDATWDGNFNYMDFPTTYHHPATPYSPLAGYPGPEIHGLDAGLAFGEYQYNLPLNPFLDPINVFPISGPAGFAAQVAPAMEPTIVQDFAQPAFAAPASEATFAQPLDLVTLTDTGAQAAVTFPTDYQPPAVSVFQPLWMLPFAPLTPQHQEIYAPEFFGPPAIPPDAAAVSSFSTVDYYGGAGPATSPFNPSFVFPDVVAGPASECGLPLSTEPDDVHPTPNATDDTELYCLSGDTHDLPTPTVNPFDTIIAKSSIMQRRRNRAAYGQTVAPNNPAAAPSHSSLAIRQYHQRRYRQHVAAYAQLDPTVAPAKADCAVRTCPPTHALTDQPTDSVPVQLPDTQQPQFHRLQSTAFSTVYEPWRPPPGVLN